MAGLLQESGVFGLSPYGIRHGGDTMKGKGYFGLLPNMAGGVSTEISSEFTHNGKNIEYPLIVPTLTKEELDYLLANNPPTEEIYKKAEDFAKQRIQQGLSPFSQPTELRYPVPSGLLY